MRQFLLISFLLLTLSGCLIHKKFETFEEWQYRHVRQEVEINKKRIEQGLAPIWTYK